MSRKWWLRLRKTELRWCWRSDRSDVDRRGVPTGEAGLMDYYELKNVQADTKMRSTIAGIKTIRWRSRDSVD